MLRLGIRTGICMTTQRRSYETGHKPKCLVIVDEGAADCRKKGKPEPARQGCVIAVGIDGATCNKFLFDARAVAACDLRRAGDCRPADAELQQNLCFLLVGIVYRARRRRAVAY